MTALVIVLLKDKDLSKMKDYGSGAAQSIQSAGGAVIGRGTLSELLIGKVDADRAVLIRFPSVAAAHDWYHGPAYQAMVALRDEVFASPVMMIIEEPA